MKSQPTDSDRRHRAATRRAFGYLFSGAGSLAETHRVRAEIEATGVEPDLFLCLDHTSLSVWSQWLGGKCFASCPPPSAELVGQLVGEPLQERLRSYAAGFAG